MDKRDRIYPGCCSSGQCAGGGDDCETCPYREHDENGIPYEEEE